MRRTGSQKLTWSAAARNWVQVRLGVPVPREDGVAPSDCTRQVLWLAFLQNPVNLSCKGHTHSSAMRHHTEALNVINMLWVLATRVGRWSNNTQPIRFALKVLWYFSTASSAITRVHSEASSMTWTAGFLHCLLVIWLPMSIMPLTCVVSASKHSLWNMTVALSRAECWASHSSASALCMTCPWPPLWPPCKRHQGHPSWQRIPSPLVW